MANIIIYDLEVFKFDHLLGAYVVGKDNSAELFQTWNDDEIISFFKAHRTDIWIGWNNIGYDNIVLCSILQHKNPYTTSCQIINYHFKLKQTIPFLTYDLMNCVGPFSLKYMELICGKNIHTTDVAFDIQRPLTDEEKKLTEGYNEDDLKQTLHDFELFKSDFELRLDLINEFKLPISENLTCTGTQLGAHILGVKKNPDLEKTPKLPKLYPTLRLKNQDVLQFYLQQDYKRDISLKVNICDAELDIKAGGAHSSIKKFHCEKLLYLDVSGYYNLLQINYDLFSRAIPEEGKKLYDYMYHQQLLLKKKNPIKRAGYKTVLLSCWGGTGNSGSEFYDPWTGPLITTSGELFICDLLEKLDGLVRVIQTNTDGIMVEPYNWNDKDKIIAIVEEWEKRTGFVIKKEIKYNLWQRDVNCYVMQDENGEIESKGDAVKNYEINDKSYASKDVLTNKEPAIIAHGVVDYLLYGILPEETVENFKKDLRYFQYPCRKVSFKRLTYEVTNPFTKETTVTELDGGVARAFAYKSTNEIGMVYKYKDSDGVSKRSKISNLPDNVFIYNYDILNPEAYELLKDKINYEYYINRIYERIEEFLPN